MKRRRTWAQFSAEVLALYGPPFRAPATLYKVRQVLGLLAEAGVRSPAELDAAAVAALVRGLSATRSPATVRGLVDYARSICAYAVSAGDLGRSPFDFRRDWVEVPEPEPEDDPRRHHPAAAIAAVLERATEEASGGDWRSGRLEALAYTVAFSGLRKMEALCLEVARVDLGAGMLRIRPNRRRRLKTRASAQPVPMADPLAAVLGRWLPQCGSPWAFPCIKARSSPWTSGEPGRKPLDELRALGERAGLAGLTFLSLRHSWATHAESLWGLSGPTIQRVLRHTSERTSRQWYRHADEANLRAAVGRISYTSSTNGANGDHHG